MRNDAVRPLDQPRLRARSRLVLRIGGPVVLAGAVIVAALGGDDAHVAHAGSTPLDALSPHGTPGPSSEGVVVHAEEVDGVRWQSVTSESSDGRCLDLEARSTSSDQRFGLVGGCGLSGVDFDHGLGFRSARGETALIPVVGTLRVPSRGGSVLNTVVFGVSSCVCEVRVSFADGTTMARRSAKGVFFVHRREATAVQRIEAIDDWGSVLVAQAFPQDGTGRFDSPLTR